MKNVKMLLEKMFAPDVNFLWDEKFSVYFLTSVTTAGEEWVKRMGAVKSKAGKIVTKSQLDEFINSAGKCGLCYQIEE